MAGWDGAGSVFAVRMRATRLDVDGSPHVGVKSQIVSNALIKITFTPQNEDGDEISLKNGNGDQCVYYKAPDTLKNIDFEVDMCTPDPEMQEMLAGGTVLLDGSDSIGYAAPAVGSTANPNGVSIEAWSKAIIGGALASHLPYIHWLWPRLNLTQDEQSLENDAAQPVFKGTGQENAGWGTGPNGDWEYESSRLWQWVREATLPDITNGYATVTSNGS